MSSAPKSSPVKVRIKRGSSSSYIATFQPLTCHPCIQDLFMAICNCRPNGINQTHTVLRPRQRLLSIKRFFMPYLSCLVAPLRFVVVQSGTCDCRNWFKSPNFMYSTRTHHGVSTVTIPSTRTMLGSFSWDMICTSFWKSRLHEKRQEIAKSQGKAPKWGTDGFQSRIFKQTDTKTFVADCEAVT